MTFLPRDQVDWPAVAAALGPLMVIDDPAMVRQKSRDFFWYSPILKRQMNHLSGDLLVLPASEDEVLHAARVARQFRVPLTVRGAGTGNYGQAMPLHGGIVLDVSRLAQIGAVEKGVLTVGAGAKLRDIDAACRPLGWELRMHPSTKRTATIGGFIAGGSGGIGSVMWGQLRDRGNLLGLRLVTLGDEPEVLVLGGDDVQLANHAYGCTGIITELKMPMAPAYDWVDVVVLFDDFARCNRFAQAIADADGVVKKLVTTIDAAATGYFRGLADHLPAGKHAALLMIAEPFLSDYAMLARDFGGVESYRLATPETEAGGVPLYEYTWNHTTLQALKVDKGITYLQALFPADGGLDLVEEMRSRFPDDYIMHCEFLRAGGRATCAALPLVRYTTDERLYEIIRAHEERGILIFDPHTFILEDGGMKKVDQAQVDFRRRTDPLGLLNPGKMKGWVS